MENQNRLNALFETPKIQGLPERLGGNDPREVERVAANVAAWKLVQMCKTVFDAHGVGLEEINMSWGCGMDRRRGRFLHGNVQVSGPDFKPFDPYERDSTGVNSPAAGPSMVDLVRTIRETSDNPLLRHERDVLSRVFASPLHGEQDCLDLLSRIDPVVRAEMDNAAAVLDRADFEQNTDLVPEPTSTRRFRCGKR